MRIAAALVNLVPYHHARWDAVSNLDGFQVDVIEITNRDAFSVLEHRGCGSYTRHTMFPGVQPEEVALSDLRSELGLRLGAIVPEVVFASGWSLRIGIEVISWAVSNRVPFVMLSESNSFDRKRSMFKEYLKRRAVLLASAGFVGGSSHASYLRELGMHPDRISLGHNAVDNQHFRSLASASPTDKHSEIPSPPAFPRYFLACSRFSEKKNIPFLIRAFARYRELDSEGSGKSETSRRTPWKLRIVGGGDQLPAIEETVRSLGLDDSVHLDGSVGYAELPRFYAHAGAFVHASTTEQWGLVVNEAMASGLPVLVSDRCGCAPDLVDEGVNGWTFDPLDVDGLAELMLRIAGMPEGERLALGEASQAIIAHWGPERFASGLKAAAEKALEIGPKRGRWLDRCLLGLLARR